MNVKSIKYPYLYTIIKTIIMEDMVFIKHNCPSLKNGKIATSRGVFSSKTVQKYLRKHGIQHYSCSKKTITTYKTIPMTFPVDELRKLFERKSYPIVIGMHFVRDSNRAFDFNNANSLIMDLFTAFDIIEDDNMNICYPQVLYIDDKHFSVDKNNAGVYIKILNKDENK